MKKKKREIFFEEKLSFENFLEKNIFGKVIFPENLFSCFFVRGSINDQVRVFNTYCRF